MRAPVLGFAAASVRLQRRILNLVERVMRAFEPALRFLDLRRIAFRCGFLEIVRALVDPMLRLLQCDLALLLEAIVAAMSDLGAGALEGGKEAAPAVSFRLRDLGVDAACFRGAAIHLFACCGGVSK